MKIHLTKKGMTRWCQDYELDMMKSAGWMPVQAELFEPAQEEKAKEEVIRLKPPAKSKGAAKSLDNTINKGDE